MTPNKNINTIIWDYDGTLVDTRHKNLNVTRRIVEVISGNDWKKYPALATVETYTYANKTSTNWRDFYTKEFGFTNDQTDNAGKAWTEYQLRDSTPTPVLAGVHEALRALGALRHGIVSQNSRDTITQVLSANNLMQYFGFIVGYEEVDLRRQKPEPDGLLLCIEKLNGVQAGCVLYVGDHETDARCAFNANEVLRSNGSEVRVVSVGALYSAHTDTSDWEIKPDYEARTPHDVVKIASIEKRII